MVQDTKRSFQDPAFSQNKRVPVHRWVPWVAGYSQRFAEDALDRYTNGTDQLVLDPFSGVGTTLVEADRAGHRAVGFEINPYAAFVSQTKLRAHRIRTSALRQVIHELLRYAKAIDTNQLVPKSSPPDGFRTRSPFYSPKVLEKVLLLMDFIGEQDDEVITDVIRLAFAATMVDYSNYSYEPSLGRRKTVGRAEIDDFPVIATLVKKLTDIADDSDWYRSNRVCLDRPDGVVHARSFFEDDSLEPSSVDLIITSPPYMNNYHYNRNTRPHMYWLQFCQSPKDLKTLEWQNFGTSWQLARERATVDLDSAIADDEILQTITEIGRQNPGKGVYGGMGWANYAVSYLNDCVRFMRGVHRVLRPGASALVVIGNSVVQSVHVPTDRFLAKIAIDCGLEVPGIHTPRETRVGSSIINSSVRVGQAGKQNRLYESVVEIRQAA